MAETDVKEITKLDVGQATREIAEGLHKLRADEISSDLVYVPGAATSFYRDILIDRGLLEGRGAHERLSRHAEQMEDIHRDRQRRTAKRLSDTDFEFRIEPNLTDGQGGYLSPPVWLNQLFATANRPGRVLADLIRARFPLPRGASQVNLPILSTGTSDTVDGGTGSVGDTDIVDTQASSAVVPLVGQADVGLQLLELSSPSAALDWALFKDLGEAYDAQLEAQLLNGSGVGTNLLGLLQAAPATNQVTYTDSSPTGSELYPFLGQAVAHIGNNRFLPPECWLLRTARWAWIQTQEDVSGLPFSIAARIFLGSTDDTPDPVGGLIGFPAFLTDALPATLNVTGSNPWTVGAGGTQDALIAARPSDMVLFESDAQTNVYREPLSGALGARIQTHAYAAALTGRRPAGIAIVAGTGLVLPSGFNN